MLRSFRVSLEPLHVYFASSRLPRTGTLKFRVARQLRCPKAALAANRMVRDHDSNVQTERKASRANRRQNHAGFPGVLPASRKLRSSGVKFRAATDQQSSGFRSSAFDRRTFAERLLRRGPAFWFPLYGGRAAAVSAREVDRGSGI